MEIDDLTKAIESMRYMETMMRLSTNMHGAIARNVDDCPEEVVRAADDWFAYLSEVAEDV